MHGLLAIVRCICFASEASIAGFCVAATWIDPKKSDGLGSSLMRFARMAGLVAAAAHILQIYVRSASMLGVPLWTTEASGVWMIASGTWQGQILIIQGLLLLLALLAVVTKRPRAGMVMAAACCAAGALSSHIIAGGETDLTSEITNALHVATAGLWFGGLLPLLVIGARETLTPALARFSRAALPLMAVILVSGTILANVNVAGWPALLGTAYGQILVIKLLCVTLVLLCAAILRQVVLPRAQLGKDHKSLKPILFFEYCMAWGTALAASVLAQAPLARHEDIIWPLRFRFAPLIAWRTPDAPAWVCAGGGSLVICLVLSFGLLRSGRRRIAAAMAGLGLTIGSALALPALTIPAFPTTYARPPIAYEAESVAVGAALFQQHCVLCHGFTGRGDGPGAAGLVPPPADLTAAHTSDHTMGDMFWWVGHGMPPSAMPAFESILNEKDRWEIINYVMALSLGYQARPLGPRAVSAFPWLPALDFTFAEDDNAPVSIVRPRGVSSKLLLFVSDEAGVAKAKDVLEVAAGVPGLLTVTILARSLQQIHGALPADAPQRKIIIDSNLHIQSAWNLYRRTLQHPDFSDRERGPAMMAFLIDRFGFVRARWRSDEDGAFDGARLAADVYLLQAEPEIIGPDVHVH